LVQWILDQVPVLETSLDSTWTLVTPNYDWMTKSWFKKPPESTEGENVKIWLTKALAENRKFSNLKSKYMFLCKLWMNQRKKTDKLITTFQKCGIFQ
jgi:hypothetical protein